jgi:serine/threonine protein kinase
MDLVSGGDLRQHLLAASSGPDRHLPQDAVIRFTRQLLLALVYLHDEKGWLHGDIKPENILLTAHPVSSDGRTDHSNVSIKLTDFGLSKTFARGNEAELASMLSNATSTTTSHIKGTLWYLSPEALQGAPVGRDRSSVDDVWSACLVILEMDTGLNLQQLMIAPGAINVEKILLNASSLLLPLLYCGLTADSRSHCSRARELLHMLDTNNDHEFEWQEFDGSIYVLVHAAANFFLERGLVSNSDCVSLPLSSPFDRVFDIHELRNNALALGRTLSSGNNLPIRRILKQSALVCGGESMSVILFASIVRESRGSE